MDGSIQAASGQSVLESLRSLPLQEAQKTATMFLRESILLDFFRTKNAIEFFRAAQGVGTVPGKTFEEWQAFVRTCGADPVNCIMFTKEKWNKPSPNSTSVGRNRHGLYKCALFVKSLLTFTGPSAKIYQALHPYNCCLQRP